MATWEAEIRRIKAGGQLGKKFARSFWWCVPVTSAMLKSLK
jgi:hypothetical protein